MKKTFETTINGAVRTVSADPARSLLDVLREDLGLTGTKYGCGEGECGACTVLVDGKRVLSCVTPASQVEGKTVTTIEGLGAADALHPVQEAFLAEQAFQCGYCTSGMILTAAVLLEANPDPNDEEIAAGLNGNVCRCCGHTRIVAAVRRAAKSMQGGTGS